MNKTFTYPFPESTVEKSSCGTDTRIYSPGPSRDYYGCLNIFEVLFLINIFTMYLLALSLALYKRLDNNVFKLYTIDSSRGVSFSNPPQTYPRNTNFGAN